MAKLSLGSAFKSEKKIHNVSVEKLEAIEKHKPYKGISKSKVYYQVRATLDLREFGLIDKKIYPSDILTINTIKSDSNFYFVNEIGCAIPKPYLVEIGCKDIKVDGYIVTDFGDGGMVYSINERLNRVLYRSFIKCQLLPAKLSSSRSVGLNELFEVIRPSKDDSY